MKESIKKENFSVFTPRNKSIPEFTEIVRTGSRYVNWGLGNRMPQYLMNLYLKSPILSSIINGTANFVFGEGAEFNPELRETVDKINSDGDLLEDVIRKIIYDELIFGGFALKINRNFKNEIVDIKWLDLQNVRISEEESIVYYYPKGFKYMDLEEAYPAFQSRGEIYPTSVLYFKGHLTRLHYPIPLWGSALAAVETSTEISKYHLRNIRNNFSSSYIVNYNNADFTEEEKKEIKRGIENNFCGADASGNFMLAFNSSKENGVEVVAIPENTQDKRFETLRESTNEEIYQAFSAFPQLFGHSLVGTGFNKQEFLEAAGVYYKMSVEPIQKDVERVFEKLLGEKCLSFKPMNFYEINF